MIQSPPTPARPLEASELLSLLMEVGERLNSTLDLDELLSRVAELIKRAVDYEVFAILLLREKAQELSIRFNIGHPDEAARRLRIKVGEGIVGRVAATRRSMLVKDVRHEPHYIASGPAIRSELAVPLIFKNRVIGVMDLESPWADYFTERHQSLLELLARPIATAIENAMLYRRSVRQSRTLQLLNEISRDLSSVLVLNELLRKIGQLTKRLIDYQRLGILLADDRTRTYNTVISLKQSESIPEKPAVPYGQGIVGAAGSSRETVVVPDVLRDPRYIASNPETRSEMAVPLLYRDRVIGVVDLESPRVGYFTDEHVRIFSTLAPQIAVAIENARLYERVVRSESLLERDLARAREIQLHLMPALAPTIRGLDVLVRFQPARELGGDLYDFLDYGKDRQVLVIGDVSGKGSPAALYGAMVSGILRSLAPRHLTPPEMLRRLNVMLLERKIDGHFITLTYAVWDLKSRQLKLANSGMPLPVLVRRGRSHSIRAEGVPLGLLENTDYQETTVKIEPGDLLAMFSDGLIEAASSETEFGMRRLEGILRVNARRPLREIIDRVFSEIARFEQGRPPRDDQTLMLIRAQ
ncbi:MAG TPA: SpoIIE family protein phosphatase [Terriglobia bacterium]|nr:SpoIIE family protein phosphatase [Terriglobia bacterium]